MSEGVFYIATGKFLAEAIESAAQVEQCMNDVSIGVITDRIGKLEDISIFDDIIEVDEASHSWADKPEYMTNSPYDKSIYLDTDIYVDSNIKDIFNLLDRFDIAAAQSPARVTHPLNDLPMAFSEFNTGVIAFGNTSAAHEALQKWGEIYSSGGVESNQPAFREAIFKSSAEVTVLPTEYNCRWPLAGYVRDKVKMFHGRLLSFEKDISGIETNVTVDEAVEIINGAHGPRVFVNDGKDIHVRRFFD